MTMAEREQELYTFVLEHFLWQFYSRSWDREANINHILDQTVAFLAGEKINVGATAQEKCYYAESKTVATEATAKFPWLAEINKLEIKAMFENIKAKLIELAITKSQNGELNSPNY
jgi:vanadium nitrogenase delta subunit